MHVGLGCNRRREGARRSFWKPPTCRRNIDPAVCDHFPQHSQPEGPSRAAFQSHCKGADATRLAAQVPPGVMSKSFLAAVVTSAPSVLP